MTTEIATREKTEDRVGDLIQRIAPALQASLPAHCTPERMTRLALTQLRMVPKLMECTQESLVGAIMQSAALGLEADGTLGQAYLIPYRDECKLVLGYRGFINLAYRSGYVKMIDADTVHDGDMFDYERGMNAFLRHKPDEKVDRNWENMTHAYAYAKTTQGGELFVVIPRSGTNSVESVKKKSAARKQSPWITHPLEMSKKTAIRRLFKLLPASAGMNRAWALDEQADMGTKQVFDVEVSECLMNADDPDKRPQAELGYDANEGTEGLK